MTIKKLTFLCAIILPDLSIARLNFVLHPNVGAGTHGLLYLFRNVQI